MIHITDQNIADGRYRILWEDALSQILEDSIDSAMYVRNRKTDVSRYVKQHTSKIIRRILAK